MKTKYWKTSFTEYNGEKEYSYQYLITAKTLEEAEKKARDFIKVWYDEGEWVSDDLCEYEGGSVQVKYCGTTETTKKQFIEDILFNYTL